MRADLHVRTAEMAGKHIAESTFVLVKSLEVFEEMSGYQNMIFFSL